MRDKLAVRLSKIKDPRNLKCSMDRDLDYRKKREEQELRAFVPLVQKQFEVS
jgi:hypothetical protein